MLLARICPSVTGRWWYGVGRGVDSESGIERNRAACIYWNDERRVSYRFRAGGQSAVGKAARLLPPLSIILSMNENNAPCKASGGAPPKAHIAADSVGLNAAGR